MTRASRTAPHRHHSQTANLEGYESCKHHNRATVNTSLPHTKRLLRLYPAHKWTRIHRERFHDFIMSITLEKTLAAAPITTRGQPTQLSADAKGERITYAVRLCPLPLSH